MQNQDSTVEPTSESLPIGNAMLGEGRLLSDDYICKICTHYSKKVESEDGGGYGYCKYQRQFVDADDSCIRFVPFA